VAGIAELFAVRKIGCAPVVDDTGKMIGLVTETDLFLAERPVPFSSVRAPSIMGQWVDPNRLEASFSRLRGRSAEDVMTRNVVTVEPEDTVGHAARLMMRHGFNHLPVMSSGRLVGILARCDILRALCFDLAS
jgi:CBS domain-containing protein